MRLLDRELKRQSEILLVDAYNIINSWDIFKDIKNLEESRRALIHTMENYQSYSKECVILVFDSYRQKTDRQIRYKNAIVLVYTGYQETADHFIEKMADRYAKKKSVRVASSDRVEQDVILSKGASRLSANELKIIVDRAEDDVKTTQDMNKTKNALHLGGLSDKERKKLEEIKKDFSD